MISQNRHIGSLLFLAGFVCLLLLQLVWLRYAYRAEQQQIRIGITEAFIEAYQREQTYRVPAEEVPVNIHCLAELFAGMMYERDIRASFVVERFDAYTGNAGEFFSFLSKKRPRSYHEFTTSLDVSGEEDVRAVVQVALRTVLQRIWWELLQAAFLTVVVALCLAFLFSRLRAFQLTAAGGSSRPKSPEQSIFQVGKWIFDSEKNELIGFDEIIFLNKKENAILYTLCVHQGNVVARHMLLEDNWGNSSTVYSRSLDTYLTALRRYLKRDPSIKILTVKGQGYKLTCQEHVMSSLSKDIKPN